MIVIKKISQPWFRFNFKKQVNDEECDVLRGVRCVTGSVMCYEE